MSDYMWTGGYRWDKGARLKGDANKVAQSLARIKDKHGRVEVDSIHEAWAAGDAALRETIGDEATVQRIGVEHMAYQILHGLNYEKVNVRTEEVEPGGRVFQPLSKVTGNPDNVRVFVETPREAIYLGSSVRPPANTLPVSTPLQNLRPVEIVAMDDLIPQPQPLKQALDRDLEAWLALCKWRERYGDIARYAAIIAAIDALR